MDLTVSDLLTTYLKWNTVRIKEVLPNLEAEILCLQPSVKGGKDSYIWQPTKSGDYSTKSGYYTAAQNRAKSKHRPIVEDFNWIKNVWSGSFSPKLKVFLWSALKNTLPLGENLQRRGMGVSVSCQRRTRDGNTCVLHLSFCKESMRTDTSTQCSSHSR